jgi:hypothetical protein
MTMRTNRALMFSATAALVVAAGHAQPSRMLSPRGAVCTYIGPDGGLWSTAANWDGGVPNGEFDALINDLGPVVNVFLDRLAQLHNLTVDADNSVTINNSEELRMFSYGGSSTISNAGEILLDSTGSNTYLRFDPEVDGDTFVLSGGGDVTASGDPSANLICEVYGQAILHNVDNTIRGGNLRLGYNTLAIINDGLVVADSPGLLRIDPPAEGFGFTNGGTIRADGGTVRLEAGEFDNHTGVIEALNGSILELANTASIHGGTIRSDTGGEVQATSGNPFLALDTGYSPTIEGILRVNNGQEIRTYGAGTVHNTGSLILDSTGSNTYFRLDPDVDGDTVIIDGGGEIVASGLGVNYIAEVYGQATLHNVDNTIRGGNLKLCYNSLAFVNDGLIVADTPGLLHIDPPDVTSGFVNTGTIRADGGTVRLGASDYDNSTGVIEAINGSVVEMTGTAHFHGGTFRGVTGGEVQLIDGSPHLDLSAGHTPTLEGTVRILNGEELRTYGEGTVNNTGTIILDSIGSYTYFRMDPVIDGDTVTLTGGGEIVAMDTGSNRMTEIYGQAILHNLDNTIRGGGLLLGYNGLAIINEGAIRADSDVATIHIDPPVDDIGFDNRGLMEATGAAGLSIAAGPFTTSGTINIDAGSSLTRSGDWTQTAGTITVDGSLDTTSGALILQGGRLTGDGPITGDVNNTGGDIEPGGSVGTLALSGDFSQSETGTLSIELGGFSDGEYDILEITGDADLGGYLDLQPVGGFVPAVGDSFTILTATGAISGWLRLPDCGDLYEIEYAPGAVIVHVTGVAYPGDFNCDGCVDQSDLGVLLAAFNKDNGGDIDGDGDTDQGDLGELLSHYGDGC